MRWPLRAHRAVFILVALQLVSLLVLATLQYRWVGEVSRAERQRLRSGLELGARRLAADFDRELTRAYLHFQAAVMRADGAAELDAPFFATTLASWRERALYPSLLGELYRVRTNGDELGLEKLDESAGIFVAVAWPAELGSLENRLRRLRPLLEPAAIPPRLDRGPPPLLAPEVPAVLVPLIRMAPHRGETWPRRRGRGGRPRFELEGLAVLRLADETLLREVLPRLAERHLGAGQQIDYRWAIAAEGRPPRVLYRSADFADADAGPFEGGQIEGDVVVEMFRFVAREDLRQLAADSGFALGDEGFLGDGGGGFRDPRFWSQRLLPPLMALMRGERGAWRLVVRHPEGSLEAAVKRLRRRNLGVGFGILLLLVLSMVMLYAASRRAQRLASQQVEFVAGISHELRTPLAAIGSLGQNLADGIVAEPAQARNYGEVIRRETARLTRMVDQVLDFSGVLAETRAARLEPLNLGPVIATAAADLRPLASEAGCRVTVETAADLPRVRGDAEALRRTLGNLIHNAVKYGGEDGRIEVRARTVGNKVEITVSDQGPGISREDLSHVFEPFYRGRNATEAQIQGGGLGLSLVRRTIEAHGGRIAVDSAPGKGTTFTVTLPVDGGEEGG